jgi:pyridinium-3,5-biscarboxylic acid mononucleotide synthase
MEEKELKDLIKSLKKGSISEEQAFAALRKLPFSDLGHTKIDHHRALRQGWPEVIFAQGKTTKQVTSIVRELIKNKSGVLVTRANPAQSRAVKKIFPKSVVNQTARTIRIPSKKKSLVKDKALVLSGGTSDQVVVEEAKETLLYLGIKPKLITDVGVAGIHRLLAHEDELRDAKVLIVAAGMEGALPSVVAGLVDKPVIGVPVSVGYGAGAGGISALLAMLNSCASGVIVVNIDNGFGAAFAAARILKSGDWV